MTASQPTVEMVGKVLAVLACMVQFHVKYQSKMIFVGYRHQSFFFFFFKLGYCYLDYHKFIRQQIRFQTGRTPVIFEPSKMPYLTMSSLNGLSV